MADTDAGARGADALARGPAFESVNAVIVKGAEIEGEVDGGVGDLSLIHI